MKLVLQVICSSSSSEHAKVERATMAARVKGARCDLLTSCFEVQHTRKLLARSAASCSNTSTAAEGLFLSYQPRTNTSRSHPQKALRMLGSMELH